MKKKILVFSFLAIVFSCSDELNTDLKLSHPRETQERTSEIKVTSEGFLSFDSKDIFNKYIAFLKEGEQSIKTRTTLKNKYNIKNFMSLNDLRDRITKVKTRTSINNDNEEEGTEDEYKLALAESLVYDDVLTAVLDTSLRVEISDTVYKITPYGTMYAHKNYATKMYSQNDPLKFKQEPSNPNEYSTGHREVMLYDTFHKMDSLFGKTRNVEMKSIDRYALVSYNGGSNIEPFRTETNFFSSNKEDNTRYYNLNTYAWRNKTLMGRIISTLRGKDVCREKYFDKQHRVQCNLYQSNYVFYASTGFKVIMQKRKKFAFVKYWIKTTAEDKVIGMENLSGEMKIVQNPFENIPNFNTFKTSYQGIVNEMVYAGIGKPTFVEDWLNDKILCFYSDWRKWDIEPEKLTADLTKKIIYQGLTELQGKILNPIGKKITTPDPRMAVIDGKNGNLKFYYYGLQGYGPGSSKSIRFSQSAGIVIRNGKILPSIPERFIIEEAEIFGAVKYNGIWMGVRFNTGVER